MVDKPAERYSSFDGLGNSTSKYVNSSPYHKLNWISFFTNSSVATGCEKSWIKAAEMGRGPLYERTGDERVHTKTWDTDRRLGRATVQDHQGTDQRFVISTHERIHFALGVLGVQDDFENLDLDS